MGIKSLFKHLLLTIAVFSIYACGGGGGESSHKTETIIEVQKQQSTNLVFADQKLTDCVQALIDSEGYTLVEEIKQLTCSGKEIVDIEGIQNLSSLEILNLSNNQIRDITPISKLGRLKQLNLQGNNLQLLSPITANQLLEQVDISDNDAIICSEQENLEQALDDKLTKTEVCIEGMQQAQDVTFEDPNLQVCIRQTAQDIGAEHLEQIQQLKCVNHAISDIDGIEQLTNLRELDLTQNNISDITPLQNLALLKKVLLGKNQISNTQPLTTSQYMQELRLDYNQLTDIQDVQTLDALRQIHLTNNQIRDLTPLQNLTGLLELRISNNRIIDIDSLANLPKLTSLWIQSNQIADLTPLQSLQHLEQLWLSNNWLTDLTPLQTQSKLKWLHLDGTETADLNPLNKLTQLKWLQLDNTRVDDITAIYPLAQLDWLHLKGNNTIPCSQLDHMQEILTPEKIDRPETCSQPQEQSGNPISTIEFQDTALRDCVYDAAREQGITNAEELTTLSCPEADITDITGLTQFPGITNIDLTGNNHISCTQLDDLRERYGYGGDYEYEAAAVTLALPESCNNPPSINAQTEQTVETGAKVDLNAEATDPNGDTLTYNWQQTAGLSVQLTNPNTATTSFTAPQGEDQTIIFQLTVTDQYGLSATQAINILVTGAILGSKNNPFLVTNYEDLKKVGTGIDGWNLDSNYLQTADIDATPSKTENLIQDTEEEYYGFEPIGNSETPFTGGYDGGEFEIDGLTINRPEQDDVGLFGRIDKGTIKNIGLTNIGINGQKDVGGLIGINVNGLISNSYAAGSVTASDGLAGGLVGINIGGTISNSYATSDVAANNVGAGGLIGYVNHNGIITESYATGNVSGAIFVGGLVGGFEGQISNSYARGNVTGNEQVGGLVGYMAHNRGDDENPVAYSSIINSYSTGLVQLQNEELEPVDFGGLVGASSSELNTVTNSFWDIETSGQETSAGGTAKTSEELKITTTFTNVDWDFEQTWMILSEGYTYPRLAWNTIEIESWIDLNNMRNNLHANYVLTRDLLTTDVDYVELAGPDANEGKGWKPVGADEKPFMGMFDGGGFTIDGLTINRPEEVYIGLFGKAVDSHYTNMKFINESILGNVQVGGIVGFAESKSESTSISNSSVSGEVIANNGFAGGLAGVIAGEKGGTLVNNSVFGNVSSNNDVGGLVGMLIGSDLVVSESFFEGKVIGRVDVGGLIGQASGADAAVKIIESYSKGTIEWSGDQVGVHYVGGLIGKVDGVTINAVDSYSIIDIIMNGAFGEYVGGIVGYVDGQSIIFNNINAHGSIDIKGHGVYVGGIAGRAFSGLEAKNCEADVDISIAEFGQQVGGFIGYFGGDIEESYATGDIEVFSRGLSVGGFGGRITYGNISKSYATGSVFVAESEEKTIYIGGFAGEADSGEYNNVYATGDVIAPDAEVVGGLFGLGAADIINSYSVGLVEGATDVGGFVGVGGGDISNSFWDTETSGQSTSAGGTGLPTAEMQTRSTFTDAEWDFADLWVMRDYPEFQWDSIAISDIEFIDTALRDCVLETAQSNGWTQSTQVTTLNCSNLEITDTTGLEQLTEITDLDLIGNNHISCNQLDELQNDIGEQGVNRPEQCNLPPTISAEGQIVTTGAQVNLNAEVIDPNGDSLTYYWQQTGGQTVELINPETAAATFTAPEDGDQTLSFQLTVTDPYGLSAVQSINISVIAAVLGTKDNPFLVTSYEDLEKVGTGIDGWNLDSHYLQTADIDASPSKTENQIPDTADEYYGFEPIGNEEAPFKGGYDGGGFEIDGLTINRAEQDGMGLFGYGYDVDLNNIHIVNTDIVGGYYAGGIAGSLKGESPKIVNSSVIGQVSGQGLVGGLVGIMTADISGIILNSHSECLVTGDELVGGLAGQMSGGSGGESIKIENSYSSGTINIAINQGGGLVGLLTGNITINNSHSNVDLIGGEYFSSYLGGLAGQLAGSSIVVDSYAISNIEINAFETNVSDVGGLIGRVVGSTSSITNSYSKGTINISSIDAFEVGGAIGRVNTDSVELTNSNSNVIISIDSKSGSSVVGGFAGNIQVQQVNISKCYSSGDIIFAQNEKSYAGYIGGFAGLVHGSGLIEKSYAIGSVSAIPSPVIEVKYGFGGFVGSSYGVDLDQVYATGNVIGSGAVGGLVGQNYGGISNSYARGSVTGNEQVGGLIGKMTHFDGDDENPAVYSSITSSYSTGQVLLQNEELEPINFGGLVGLSTSELNTVTNSFWDIETSGQETSAGGEPKTSEELKTVTTFTNVGWDFDETWIILTEGYSYPRLTWNTIEIESWTDLNNMRNNMHANYILTRDLLTTDADYAELAGPDANDGKGWEPVGVYEKPFMGTFNGSNFAIDGLMINRPREGYVGLFGLIKDSNIRNLGLTNVDINSSSSIGGVAGNSTRAIIYNSHVAGVIVGSGSSIGGLVGRTDEVIIANSYAIINVTADYWGGGLVGYSFESKILNSHAAAEVSGNNELGALVGVVRDGVIIDSYASGNVIGDITIGGLVGQIKGEISNSYAHGNVTGNKQIGGLVGLFRHHVGGQEQVDSIITNSYSTGIVQLQNVELEPVHFGGLVGVSDNELNTITNSFWNIETSEQETSAGGIGLTTIEMQNQSSFTEWDFDTIWEIAPESYPVLQ